ncbi:ribonuclease M5 [Mycoplasma sp. P36-A1]|uniref:ribonuclease M5 n=1 Tax=Mycoplasma sp. P36-A1 TaxID=3252900 RepID=UPI003C2FC343
MKIKEIIVVEGEHDATKIKQIYDADVIVTNGSAVSDSTLNLIKASAKNRGIIIFTDPDFPGEKIRRIVSDAVPNAKHAFIRKIDAIDNVKRKVGVEHATDENIKAALKDVKEFTENDSLSWQEYIDLGLIGNAKKREVICNKLNIGRCNAKTLYKRLNMMNICFQKLEKMIGELDE